MLARRLLAERRFLNLRKCYAARTYSQKPTVQQMEYVIEEQLTAPPKKKPARPPFVKSLLLEKIDTEFFDFPEIVPEARFNAFIQWLKPIETYMLQFKGSYTDINTEEIKSELRNLGVFRACIDEKNNGLALSEMELAKLIETLSILPWLGSYFIENYRKPVDIIYKYATEEQKQRFLPGIAKGDIIPTICLTDTTKFSNVEDIKAEALADIRNNWKLSGKKCNVFNGTGANLYLVAAHCLRQNVTRTTTDCLTFLLIERNSNNITFDDVLTPIGQQELSQCTVTFDNVTITSENIMGEIGSAAEILEYLITPGKNDIGAKAVGILRNFIEALTNAVLHKKHYNENLYEVQTVKRTLATLSRNLYGMESVVYLTAGMMDQFENQDVEIEKAIIDAYCAETCVKSIYSGLQLINTPTYMKKNYFMRLYEDALCLTLRDVYPFDTHSYIAWLCLKNLISHRKDDLQRTLNPTQNPLHAIRQHLRIKLEERVISDNLHLTLQTGGEALQDTIYALHGAAMGTIIHHGVELPCKHMDLYRLSQMITLMYVTAAMLARASRAYCIGLKNSHHDCGFAVYTALETKQKVKAIARILQDRTGRGMDNLHEEVANCMYSMKGYYASHPLDRVI